jgi:hypothetical protein
VSAACWRARAPVPAAHARRLVARGAIDACSSKERERAERGACAPRAGRERGARREGAAARRVQRLRASTVVPAARQRLAVLAESGEPVGRPWAARRAALPPYRRRVARQWAL